MLPGVSIIPPGEHAWDVPKVVVLPALTLILAVTPYISRIMRASMVEVLHSDYVTMARLKGLSNRTVIWRHAVPNAIVPAIQVSALQLAYMAGGVVVVEYVFSYNGIGSQLVTAVTNRDIPTVQALVDDHRRGLRDREPGRRSVDDRRHPATEDGRTMSTDLTADHEDPGDPTVGAELISAPSIRSRQWLSLLKSTIRQTRGPDRARRS